MADHLSDLALDEMLVGPGANETHEAHLASCPRCQARRAALEEARRRTTRAPQFEQVFARLAAQPAARESSARPAPRWRWRPAAWWRVSLPLATAAAAAALVLVAVPPDEQPGVRIKGEAYVSLVRVDTDATVQGTADTGTLQTGERVALSVGPAGHRFVLVMAVDPSGSVSQVWPPGQPRSGRVPAGPKAVLAPPFEVTAGSMVLHAFFSDTAIPAEAAAQALARAAAERRRGAQPDASLSPARLAGAGARARLVVEVAEAAVAPRANTPTDESSRSRGRP